MAKNPVAIGDGKWLVPFSKEFLCAKAANVIFRFSYPSHGPPGCFLHRYSTIMTLRIPPNRCGITPEIREFGEKQPVLPMKSRNIGVTSRFFDDFSAL